MNTASEQNIAFINPNWSAFILLITLLSVMNTAVGFVSPLFDAKLVLGMVNIAITFILWADFLYLLFKSPDKKHYMTREYGWLSLLGTIPYFRFLKIIWFWLTLRKNGRTLREFLSRITVRQNAEGTLLLVLFISIVVFEFAIVFILDFEEGAPGSNIHSISDAVWWAFVTVATVGYGDKYPVTIPGRIVGILLMAVGIALFTVIIGSLAEWFQKRQPVRPFSPDADPDTNNAVAEIRHLLEQHEKTNQQTIAELKTRLTQLEANLKERGGLNNRPTN